MNSPELPLLITGSVGGIVSLSALWAYSVFSPRCQFWAPVVRSLPQRDAVALTFDDGPHSEYTPQILDILAARGTKAAFFLIGRFAEQYPELVRRIYEEGHTIGNHSWDHEHFGVNRKREYWDDQLKRTQEVIAGVTGMPPMLFRPPMGFKTRHIAAAAAALKLPIVGWSVRGLDTRETTGEKLAKRVLKRVSGHDIVLLHDGIEPFRKAEAGKALSQRATVEALPAILDGVAEKELTVVSLVEALVAASDEMRARKPQLKS